MELAVSFAASGGARWGRFFGILAVLVAVLVIRTVLVRLMEPPKDATGGRDDDAPGAG